MDVEGSREAGVVRVCVLHELQSFNVHFHLFGNLEWGFVGVYNRSYRCMCGRNVIIMIIVLLSPCPSH